MNATPKDWEITNYDGLSSWISIVVTAKEPKHLVRKSTLKGIALFAKSKGYSDFSGATEVESVDDGSYRRSFAFRMNEQEEDNDWNGGYSSIRLDNTFTGGDINTFFISDTKMIKLQVIKSNEDKFLSMKISSKDGDEAWGRVDSLFLRPKKIAQLIELLGGSLTELLNAPALMNNVYKHSD